MSANRNGVSMDRAKRYELIVALRDQGKTFRQIAEIMGVALSTVTSVYYDPSGEKERARKARYGGVCADCGTSTSYTSGGVATRCRDCQAIRAGSLELRHAQAATVRGRVRWTDEEIFDAIRSIARDGVANKTAYDEASSNGRRGRMPSYPTVVSRFGSWRNAVHKAGLRIADESRPETYRSRVTGDGLLCCLEDCAAELGYWPSARAYAKWAPGRGFSCALIRIRFGSWMDAIERARERNGGKVPA